MNRARPILSWIVSILLPFLLLMTSISVLFNPWWVDIEYRTPNFPPDEYGFTQQERLHWSKISIQYLVENQPASFLADQRLPDGSPLYIERELSHMVDVQVLYQKMIQAMFLLWILMVALGILAWRAAWLRLFAAALARGGWIAIGMIAAVLLGVVAGFEQLFTDFHRIFFSGDTWLFRYSDTLIRLFPMQFWQDAFIWVGGITLLAAALCIFIGKRVTRI